MTQNKKRFLSSLSVIIIIGNELIRTFIRPVYGKSSYGLISDILGWLPNFLASFGFIAIGITFTVLAEDISGKHFTRQRSSLLLGILVVTGLIGFIVHEITQKGSGLYYDLNDIYATLAGTLAGAFLFYMTMIRPEATTSHRHK